MEPGYDASIALYPWHACGVYVWSWPGYDVSTCMAGPVCVD